MMYLKAALTAIEASGLIIKLAAGAGLFVVALATYGVWHHKVYQSGVADAIAGIAREDAHYLNRALAMRGTFKACRDQGRQWDQGTGKCL